LVGFFLVEVLLGLLNSIASTIGILLSVPVADRTFSIILLILFENSTTLDGS